MAFLVSTFMLLFLSICPAGAADRYEAGMSREAIAAIPKLALKNAEKGMAEPQFNIAVTLLQRKFHQEGAYWLKQAISQKYAPAVLFKAKMWFLGDYGVTKNPQAAIDLLIPLAREGHVGAQMMLAAVFAGKDNIISPDFQKAAFWTEKAASQGVPDAQVRMAQIAFEQQNPTQAVAWLKKAADKNHVQGQFLLGMVYVVGKGVEKNTKLAEFWLLKSARAGHREAILRLASSYFNGEFTSQKPLMGAYILRLGGDFKIPQAQKAWRELQKQNASLAKEAEAIIELERRLATVGVSEGPLVDNLLQLSSRWQKDPNLAADNAHALKILEDMINSANTYAQLHSGIRKAINQLIGQSANKDDLDLAPYLLMLARNGDTSALERLCRSGKFSFSSKLKQCDFKAASTKLITQQVALLKQWAHNSLWEAYRLLSNIETRSKKNKFYAAAFMWACAGKDLDKNGSADSLTTRMKQMRLKLTSKEIEQAQNQAIDLVVKRYRSQGNYYIKASDAVFEKYCS